MAVDDCPTPRWVSTEWKAQEAVVLLLVGGFLLATIVNLSKAGVRAGLEPVQIAFAASAGAGALLLCVAISRGGLPLNWVHLRAYVALGAISYAGPTVLGAAVAGAIGAGYSSVLFALSPIMTFLLSAALGLQRVGRWGAVGLLLGMAGTVLLVGPGLVGAPADLGWMILGLALPAALATGNVLRALIVPRETPSAIVVAGVLMAAATILAWPALSAPTAPFVSPAGLRIVTASVLATALFNVVLFRLQAAAGPIVLSQLGYVAAAFGIGLAAMAYGENPPASMLVAVALIAAGVRLVNRGAAKARR